MFAFYLPVLCTCIYILHGLSPFDKDHEHVPYFCVVFIVLMVAFSSSLWVIIFTKSFFSVWHFGYFWFYANSSSQPKLNYRWSYKTGSWLKTSCVVSFVFYGLTFAGLWTVQGTWFLVSFKPRTLTPTLKVAVIKITVPIHWAFWAWPEISTLRKPLFILTLLLAKTSFPLGPI